ncbi:MAG TPA: GspH/FimT family pseudopilin [Gammaproteobacteria bacterium]|nr:GspH/FimT family pseudopilin [Gammaproteobacteria bacterium]
MDDQRGFSILELCTVILILSFITTFAIPAFSQFLMRGERAMVLDRVKAAIEFAKQEAFTRGKTITICASINHRTCHANDWSAGVIIIEMDEQLPRTPSNLLYVFPKLQHGKLNFDQFGTYLNITADGMTINNGTFIYCPKNGDRREADALIINNATRTYRPTQKNRLGVLLKNVGTAEETPLSCR